MDLFYPYMLGGIEQRAFEVAKHLVEAGDNVTVFTSKLSGVRGRDTLLDGGLEVVRVGFVGNPLGHRVQVASLSFIISSLGLREEVKGLDVLDVNQFCSLSGGVMGRINGVPTVYTIHDLGRVKLRHPHRSILLKSIQFLHESPAVVAVSSHVRWKLVSFLGFNPTDIRVVPNGVDYNQIRSTAKQTEERINEGTRILYVGRLVPYKNVDHLLQAVSSLNAEGYRLELDVVGMGQDLPRLIQCSRSLELGDTVRFHGFIEEKSEVYRVMGQADVFVNPSVVEGFGITLLEAMASGTPVLAYNLRSYSDFLRNGINGLAVKSGNKEALKQGLKRILDNPQLARRLRRNGLRTARRYDITRTVRALRNIYKKAINRSRGK